MTEIKVPFERAWAVLPNEHIVEIKPVSAERSRLFDPKTGEYIDDVLVFFEAVKDLGKDKRYEASFRRALFESDFTCLEKTVHLTRRDAIAYALARSRLRKKHVDAHAKRIGNCIAKLEKELAKGERI